MSQFRELIGTVQPQMQTLQAAVPGSSTDFPNSLFTQTESELQTLSEDDAKLNHAYLACGKSS